MSGRHVRNDKHTSEAENEGLSASKEIVAIRARRAELAAAMEAIPEDAAEAVDALKQRDHDLHARLAELQDSFGHIDPETPPDPDDGPPADRTLIPPL